MKEIIQKSRPLKLLGGLVPFAVLVLSVGLSIMLSPWFSFNLNALSDLGISEARHIFNFGLITSGVLLFIGEFFRRRSDKIPEKMISNQVMLSAASLALIGVFTLESYALHMIAAITFFIAGPAVVVFFGIGRWKTRTGKALVFLGIFSIALWLVPRPGPGIAIPEAVSAVIIFAAFNIRVRLLEKPENRI